MLPIANPGQRTHAGVVVAGLSPRLEFDDAYRGFTDSLAVHVATAIANARMEDGEPIREDLLNGFFLLMVIAGNETTRNSIAGGMEALIQHPDQHRRLREDRGLLPTAVEEILRWVSPVLYMRRTATRDTGIAGVRIAEGDKVVMWYPAANRDERVFPDADRFDVARDPNPHLAFGIGQHFCLGAQLARLQLRVMFSELLDRLPNVELTGPW